MSTLSVEALMVISALAVLHGASLVILIDPVVHIGDLSSSHLLLC